jgi:hypothetical protein
VSQVRAVARFLLAAAACVTLSACDLGNVCGPGQQRESEIGYCVCLPNHVPGPRGGLCVPCGAHEEAVSGKCQCAAGYARPSADKACEPALAGLGAACDAARPCAEPRFPHCQVTDGTAGYCTTTGCTGAADCAGGYACVSGAGGSFCKRPPVGQGKACVGNADCAGQEATFCDTLYTKQCLVEGCAPGAPGACHDGWRCCDFSGFGLAKTLCVPLAECPAR